MRRLAVVFTGLALLSLRGTAANAAPPSGRAAAPAGMVSLGARTIAPPSPVWVIGSYDSSGKANMMTASWVGVCCSKPPCVMIALRAATYTHGNIAATGAFTVNIPSARFAREAAYFGSVSGRDVDKLAATGLTATRSSLVNAPYIAEFPLLLECEVIRTVELGLHTMFIGEIRDVKASEAVLNDEGRPDLEKLDPFVFGYGSDGFYGTGGLIGRISLMADEIEKQRAAD
jgi:flavin reductase (DIM6/NTAB) family NADH-FMN oxidoreductase RutF